MKRRDFIRYTAPVAAVPLLLNGMPVQALANSSLLKALAARGATLADDRILVIVQLFGGNDGVNTVLPIDQYAYLSLDNTQGGRSNILIPESKGLKLELNGVDQYVGTRLSPGMTAFKRLFSEEKLGLIQGVGYKNPDFSHFRATDIWLTGSDSNVVDTTGWAGRDLETQYPNYYNNPYKGPLAITIGSVSSPVFLGADTNHGLAVQDPSKNNGYITGNNDTAPNSFYGGELEFVRGVIDQSNQFNSAVYTAHGKGKNVGAYPNSNLANQLKSVARLISGGLGTKIYLVNAGGFDTHSNQHDTADPSTGYHVNLWKSIADAVAAFQDDLAAQTDLNGDTLDEKVFGFTFSEFGRTIKSNTTFGTDHGTTGPMFVFGKHANAAMLGGNPQVYNQAGDYVESDLPLQFDYRSIYASILHQWFAVPTTDINGIFNKTFEDENSVAQDMNDLGFHANLPLFKTGFVPRSTSAVNQNAAVVAARANYPNPVSTETTIPFTSAGEDIQIDVFNANGQLITNVASGFYPQGNHEVKFVAEGLAKGVYVYKIRTKNRELSNKMLVQ